ncbi:MAG: phytoene/squalene synthase family protein [Pseudomonadota bacterium]
MMRSQFTSQNMEDCRRIIRLGSKSFYFASLMLPAQIRAAATALYAFCRISDDIADDPKANLESVMRLRDRLDAAYAGRPFNHSADKAFSDVVSHYKIPISVPNSMIEGFEWDVTGKRYETLSDVIDYSARVAGTVGVMMSILMGRRRAQTLARACDLGVSMQLINIARDVGEDARNGRVYLPAQWLEEESLSQGELIADVSYSDALGRVVERLLDTADLIYYRGVTGINELPGSCQMGIRAAGLVYAEIGQKVRENGFNSIDTRAYTTKGRKLGLMLQSARNFLDDTPCDTSEPMPEIEYLIEAAATEKDEPFGDGEWLIELFSELEKRDRAYLAREKEQASVLIGQ